MILATPAREAWRVFLVTSSRSRSFPDDDKNWGGGGGGVLVPAPPGCASLRDGCVLDHCHNLRRHRLQQL